MSLNVSKLATATRFAAANCIVPNGEALLHRGEGGLWPEFCGDTGHYSLLSSPALTVGWQCGTRALKAGLFWTLAMQINRCFGTLLGWSEANTRAADCMTEFACDKEVNKALDSLGNSELLLMCFLFSNAIIHLWTCINQLNLRGVTQPLLHLCLQSSPCYRIVPQHLSACPTNQMFIH